MPVFTICNTPASRVNKFAKEPKDEPKIAAKAPPVSIPIWRRGKKERKKERKNLAQGQGNIQKMHIVKNQDATHNQKGGGEDEE